MGNVFVDKIAYEPKVTFQISNLKICRRVWQENNAETELYNLKELNATDTLLLLLFLKGIRAILIINSIYLFCKRSVWELYWNYLQPLGDSGLDQACENDMFL